jgi:hypothetical protein
MTRVQIPAYTTAWMKGDRFGNVVKVTRHSERYVGVPSHRPKHDTYELAHVLLDKSNRLVKVILADCEVLS